MSNVYVVQQKVSNNGFSYIYVSADSYGTNSDTGVLYFTKGTNLVGKTETVASFQEWVSVIKEESKVTNASDVQYLVTNER